MNNFSSQFQGVINTRFGQKILDFLNDADSNTKCDTFVFS